MQHNKFGMFIHWGIYALTEFHEQAFARLDIPREEYEALAQKFNPVKYDPEEWVLLAKKAGMKYICFTTKHHDGFCMWNTKYTDYNIMNTPYGKDVLKMLANACEKHGMLLSLYYSNPDWHHPHAYNNRSTHQWKAIINEEADFNVYIQYIKDQVTELLTNYGEIYTFFWDIPPQIEDKSINELIRKLQPEILINDRGFDAGDFSTPERDYSTQAGINRFSRMTEACDSIDRHSWGYNANYNLYSCKHILSGIDKIMSMGGNYLLNIGPMADGTFHTEHKKYIEHIGDWYCRMNGALENHEADDFQYNIVGDIKCVSTKKNNKSYFNFFEGLLSHGFVMKNYPSIPKQVRLLNTGETLECSLERLTQCFNADGTLTDKCLYVKGIPVNELSEEPIVIEIEW